MKYIRTKDGRIAEIKENMVVRVCDDATRLVYKDCPYSCVLTGDDDIFKQADTIEELCDEFVGIVGQGHCIIHNVDFIEGERIIPLSKVDYYGAIWTEWGLKYVAKTNEKGELELL